MFGFGEIASGLATNGVTSLARRGASSVKTFFVRGKLLKAQLDSAAYKNSIIEGALDTAIRNLESIADHMTHLDASSGAFDPERVTVAAHTMRLFKVPMPVAERSASHPNALQINYGRDHGVIPGISISFKSRRDGYEEIYILQNRDIRNDHICAHPPNLDLARVDIADLIVSFVLGPPLNQLEQSLAVLLDVSMSGVDEARAAIRRATTDPAVT
jgi:hypothetical protein